MITLININHKIMSTIYICFTSINWLTQYNTSLITLLFIKNAHALSPAHIAIDTHIYPNKVRITHANKLSKPKPRYTSAHNIKKI